jgi:hypothetical protein
MYGGQVEIVVVRERLSDEFSTEIALVEVLIYDSHCCDVIVTLLLLYPLV